MLVPKKEKRRRVFRRRGKNFRGKSLRGTRISFGKYGLKAVSLGEVTSRQIEAARRAMTRYTKRDGKIWINIFPHQPITRKASEVPMGSGKGSPEFHVSMVKPGRVIFEIDGVNEETAREALRLAAQKLPVQCKFISAKDQIA